MKNKTKFIIWDNGPDVDEGKRYEIGPWEGDEIPVMSCGHTALGTTNFPANPDDPIQKETMDKGNGTIRIFSCPICNVKTASPIILEMKGRKARCDCGKEVPSDASLPFFKYDPDKEFDEYYCGHAGWN